MARSRMLTVIANIARGYFQRAKIREKEEEKKNDRRLGKKQRELEAGIRRQGLLIFIFGSLFFPLILFLLIAYCYSLD